MPLVRSRLLLLLSSKKASELSTVEGKKKLADEIIAQVKQPFTPQGGSTAISGVFFTSFVIQ
jgi:flagellar FliL protein